MRAVSFNGFFSVIRRHFCFGLIQKCVGWFVQAALMLMGLGILVILSYRQ